MTAAPAPAVATKTTAQAWIELRAEDPEAVSALGVARAHLPAGQGLLGLRRLRLFELRGPLPERAALEDLLHRSTRFYNPHKERCTVRAVAGDPVPFDPDERVALVWERDGVRRPAAERWWKHETGQAIEVREAVAWAMRYDPGVPARERAAELLGAAGQARGLLCNPHAQQGVLAQGAPPLPWLGLARKRAPTGARKAP